MEDANLCFAMIASCHGKKEMILAQRNVKETTESNGEMSIGLSNKISRTLNSNVKIKDVIKSMHIKLPWIIKINVS